MSFFSQRTATVDIDSENRVTIRELTHGEKQDIQRQATRISAKMQAGGRNGRSDAPEGEAVVDAVLIQSQTLHKSVVSWEGPGFEDRPVTAENIDALPSWVVDQIIEAINGLDPEPLTEAEKKA